MFKQWNGVVCAMAAVYRGWLWQCPNVLMDLSAVSWLVEESRHAHCRGLLPPETSGLCSHTNYTGHNNFFPNSLSLFLMTHNFGRFHASFPVTITCTCNLSHKWLRTQWCMRNILYIDCNVGKNCSEWGLKLLDSIRACFWHVSIHACTLSIPLYST